MRSFNWRQVATAPAEKDRVAQRQQALQAAVTSELSHLYTLPFDADIVGQKNCENLIGSVAVPVGVAGPVIVRAAESEPESWLLPLATTEGALVASVNRGCRALSAAGGADIMVRRVGMSRAPVFRCASGRDASALAQWIESHFSEWQQVAATTSRHLQLTGCQTWVRGREVFVRFVAETDEAMGMNMVTIATQAIADQIVAKQPHVALVTISSNVCCDKKDSSINRILGRGYWVQAEAVIPDVVVAEVLKTTADQLVSTHVSKNLVGSNVAGSLSQNMQVANVAAAMFIATGQDVAHVVEAAQASTTVELTTGGVYVAVTLPNLNVGSVGGGTWLPAQTEARNLITEQGQVTASQLAGAVAVGALAAEISGLAALSVHQLTKAHQRLGRMSP